MPATGVFEKLQALAYASTLYSMISIIIGYVSNIIAGIIFILQFLLPNALIVILVGNLKNEHTAMTWSIVERNLLSFM